MSNIERLSVTLTMAEAVREAVASGDYASTSEVVRDAIRVWLGRRDFTPRDLEVLRRNWNARNASGIAGPPRHPRTHQAGKSQARQVLPDPWLGLSAPTSSMNSLPKFGKT